jgi:hypothetical protein
MPKFLNLRVLLAWRFFALRLLNNFYSTLVENSSLTLTLQTRQCSFAQKRSFYTCYIREIYTANTSGFLLK